MCTTGKTQTRPPDLRYLQPFSFLFASVCWLIFVFVPSPTHTFLVLGTVDNSIESTNHSVKNTTYWMVQLFWLLLVWLIVLLPLFQVTWGFFKWECSSNLHVRLTLAGLGKEIFFSSETPIRSLKTFNKKNALLYSGQKSFRSCVYICRIAGGHRCSSYAPGEKCPWSFTVIFLSHNWIKIHMPLQK